MNPVRVDSFRSVALERVQHSCPSSSATEAGVFSTGNTKEVDDGEDDSCPGDWTIPQADRDGAVLLL